MNKNYLKLLVLVVVCLILPTYAAIKLVNNENLESQGKANSNLGMTFEQFKNEYNKQTKKITQNDIGATLIMLFDENITPPKTSDDHYLYRFSFSDSNPIVMFVGIDDKTKNIMYIEILIESLREKNSTYENLLLQSAIYSTAASVFNSKWENQNYREKNLKRLYDNIDNGEYDFVDDNIRYQLGYNKDLKFLFLRIEAENWYYNL